MGMLALLSLLGLGLFAGLLDSDDAGSEQNAEPEDTEPEVTASEGTEPEVTEPDLFDLSHPEPPTLDGTVFEVTDAVGKVNDSGHTEGGAYRVTQQLYSIKTGSGDDTLVVDGDIRGSAYLGDGDDAAWGDEGRDFLRGEAGNDSLFGGGGNDGLYDIEGENSLYGGDGDDFIRGSSGSTIVGGDGADTFDLYLSTAAENPLRLLDYDPEMDELAGIRLHVSDGDVYDLTAVAREDGEGTDLIFDGRVLAEVFGASVDDLIDIPFTIELDGGTYTDDDAGHQINSSFKLPETISAGGGDDSIFGGPGDLIDGGDGNDLIFARGQLTQDVSDSNAMSTIQGGSGDDTILSTNANVLTGGDGADIFGLSASRYYAVDPGSGFDLPETIITDFNPAEDVIYIERGFITQAGGTLDEIAATVSIQVWSNGEGADILAGDEVIARVAGGQTLRVEDLVIPETVLETAILGWDYH